MTCKSYDIPKTLIWEAWLHVKANQGAAGIDAETIERFETKLAANLYKLSNWMSSGSYFPPPVKAVPIPKKSGGVRVLGVPTVSDRIAQTAVKMSHQQRQCLSRPPQAVAQSLQRRRHQEPAQLSWLAPRSSKPGRSSHAPELDQGRNRKRPISTGSAIRAL